MMKAWEEFLLKQEQELGLDTVKKWLRTLKLIRFDACNLYLEAKDAFQALWFEEHVRKKTQNLVNNNHKSIKIHLSVAGKTPAISKPKPVPEAPFVPTFQMTFNAVDASCTFENFIPNEVNQVPFQLLQSLDQEKTLSFNPIYLYGPSGSGKSHLLMSLANDQRKKGKEVIYVRSETFTDHVVSAIRSGEMGRFRQAYRHADLLLIDDVNLFSRKSATQEELFHTFNALHLIGKQIVLTAICHPKELQEIEPRLISRFEWGIVLGLEGVRGKDLERLLMKKAEVLSYNLSPKILDFLVDSFKSSTKAAIRALEALILRSHIQKGNDIVYRPMTIDLAEHYLADLLLAEKRYILTPEKIIHSCAEHYGIKPEDILGKAKTRATVQPRQIAMYLCRNSLKLPYTKIGELFGRDHSTVMSSIQQIQRSVDEKDTDFCSALLEIEKKL